MYEVINNDYPRLETYLCFECGFHADTILIRQKRLYQAFQKLFHRTKNKELLKLKNYKLPDELLQRHNYDIPDEDDTEPSIERYIRFRTVVKICVI